MSETMMAQRRADVDEVNRRFMEAFERGDAASVAALYAEDAVVLPPDAPMISGRAEIEEFWRGLMAAGARGVNLVTLRLAGSGDVLHEVGRATITVQPEGGETNTQTVKYVAPSNAPGRARLPAIRTLRPRVERVPAGHTDPPAGPAVRLRNAIQSRRTV